MPIQYSEQMTPRESLQHEWDVESRAKEMEHNVAINRMQIEGVKLEIKLKQEDATRARRHQELMKKLELEIRREEAKWTQWYRIPVLIIKLPLYCLFGIAFIVATAKGDEINQGDFWKLLR